MLVSVIGTGVMGKEIALLLAQRNDIESISLVSLISDKKEKEKELRNYFEIMTERFKRSISENSQKKIKLQHNLQDTRSSDFLIETITEKSSEKIKLVKELNSIVSNKTHFFSNTSSLSIKMLAKYYKYPINFFGMHFFNPAFQNKLIELVYCHERQKQALKPYKVMLESLNKKVIIVNDSPGFIVNRLLLIQINEACEILEGLDTTASEIDLAYRTATNSLQGPFQRADLIGNDIVLLMLENLLKETGNKKFSPNQILKTMVNENRLGRKTLNGFYTYESN